MEEYLFEYDDPYKILAHAIVGFERPSDVMRTLTDDEYLLSLIIKETREQDIGGRFLDCIIEEILRQKKRMEYMHELDRLAAYYYRNLDKKRLRAEIIEALSSAGIVIDYSDGSVSSDNA